VFRAGEKGNREETDSMSVLVYSSGRHRGAGPSSVSEIHAGGHSALANKRFEGIVFVNLGAISAAAGNQRATSEDALCVRVFDPVGSSGCLDKSDRHLKKTHSRGAVGVVLLTFTPVDKSDLVAEVVQKLSEWIGIRRVIFLLDRKESNGVEGTNTQILRHLRTLVHDLRVTKKWSDPTILSHWLFALNDGVNSGTGVRPLEYLVGENVLVTEYVLDQASAHMNRCDAKSLICVEAALGGEPQRNVTSVESTPGVQAGSRKWVQEVPSGEGHEPAEGSDLTTFYCRDRLTKRDLDVGQLELESHTPFRQRSCGTQAVRRSSAAHDASTRLGRFDYSEWTSASGRGLHASLFDRHGGTVEGDRCLWVFDPGGPVGCRA